MKVKAKAVGFFGKYRRVGDEFDIDNETQFSNTWMIKVEIEKKVSKPKSKAKNKS